ncbi:MAG: hypothetical protein OES24_03155 [Acidimicrobiia bacterium]|nr:hypothetical protein [Acidimicrobiia bacterium]
MTTGPPTALGRHRTDGYRAAVVPAVLPAAAAVITVAVVGAAAIELPIGLGVLGGAVVLAVVIDAPVRAAYWYLALAPLVAGFGRDSVVPLVRPGELLLVVLLIGVGVRFARDALTGHPPAALVRYRITALDRSIVAMAIFSSVVPLLWRAARGYRPLMDDLLYATFIWKYLLVFVLFRLVVTNRRQVRVCLIIMLSIGVVIGAVAILQSLNVAGVPRFLAAVYDEPLTALTNNRGSSTLGTSHGTADVMAFDLGLTAAMWHHRMGPRLLTASGCVFFGLACFASGQISAAFALAVAITTFGFLTRRLLQTLTVAIPAAAVATVLLWPVVNARLVGTGTDRIPDSWNARYFNLTNYFWPELFRKGNWILGVRPAGRVPSYEPWRDWVYIESGHTWLLWTGGVPLLMAFAWFSWHGLAGSVTLAGSRPRSGAVGEVGPVVGLATAIALSVVFVLMLFDVHLTLRGPADALFPLLAMLTVPTLWPSGHRWERVLGIRRLRTLATVGHPSPVGSRSPERAGGRSAP